MNIRDIGCEGIVVVMDTFENVLTMNGGSLLPEFEVDTLEELRFFVSKHGFEKIELDDNIFNIFVIYKIGRHKNVVSGYESTSYKQIGYISLQTLKSKIRDKRIETFL